MSVNNGGRPRRALTIVEVVLAIGILAMAAVSFFPVFNQGVTFTREIRDQSVLMNLAELLVNDYSQRINTLPAGTTISFYEDDVTPEVRKIATNPVVDGLPRFKAFGTVRPSLLCDSGGYEIAIRFTWDSGGREKSFSLFTVKAARDQP